MSRLLFEACATRRNIDSEDQRETTRHYEMNARRLLHRNAANDPGIDMVLKIEYLDQFHATKNVPLYEQVWCREAMRQFHFYMRKHDQGHWLNCGELAHYRHELLISESPMQLLQER